MSKEQWELEREYKIESLIEQGFEEEEAERIVDDDEEMTLGSMDRF